MNRKLAALALLGSRINRQHVQLLLVLLSLVMLILGIGAPADAGGPTRSRLPGV